MIEQDTIRLLRECDAGVKMGTSSIEQVLEYVKSEELKEQLEKSLDKHRELDREIQNALSRYHDEGKAPNPIASGMSWLKTNIKLTVNESDNTIADLMTDGCNMGVKSLSKYLGEYKAADEGSKDITRRLIATEEALCKEMRKYL